MDINDFQADVAQWANDRNLYETATPGTQMLKLIEEITEWMHEVKTGDKQAEKMEFGDIMVVAANIAELRGLNMGECCQMAYNKIKDRKGKMINGTFVKESTK